MRFILLLVKLSFQIMKHIIVLIIIFVISQNEATFITFGVSKTMDFESYSVFGNSSALHYYYINLYVGSQMSKQSLIIDTGSSLTGFPCKGLCKNCGQHLNSYYNLNGKYILIGDSITSKLLTCEDAKIIKLKCDYCNNNNLCSYRQSYGEGSTYSGVFVQDNIFFGDKNSRENGLIVPFGCHTKYIENYLEKLIFYLPN